MKSKYLELLLILILFAALISRDILISKYDYKKNINTSKSIVIDNNNKDINKLFNEFDLTNNESNMIIARVLYRNINTFYKYILINKGTKHHIQEGDAVVNNNIFVGVVKKAFKNKSLVMLSTNSELKLSVKINDSFGTLSNIGGQLLVKDLSVDGNFKVGDIIYTSGLTDIPENFIVGSIQKIENDSSDLKKTIFVNSNVVPDLRYVAIIKDKL